MFDHIYLDNNQDTTLVLLHGTGGSKSDFLFLDSLLKNRYNLLGLQGNVREQGMARFFARKAAGVFDQESIWHETDLLRQFLEEWLSQHQQTFDDVVWLGNSNGANMILAMLFRFPQVVKKAVLLHPMLPFIPRDTSLNFAQTSLFISQGKFDEMISEEHQTNLQQVLTSQGATLTLKTYAAGHQPTQQELSDVVEYLLTISANTK